MSVAKYLTPNIVYQADITNNVENERRVDLDLSETPFKDRYRNHVRDFNNEIHYNKTELSKYVWDLKRNNKEPHITWTIVCKVYGTPKRNFCRLCLKEKLLIIKFPNQDILLNKRSELISKCRQENKNLIMNVKEHQDKYMQCLDFFVFCISYFYFHFRS